MFDDRHYVVRYCAIGSQKYRYFNTTNRNCMINELKPYTQYEFTVKVVKSKLNFFVFVLSQIYLQVLIIFFMRRE